MHHESPTTAPSTDEPIEEDSQQAWNSLKAGRKSPRQAVVFIHGIGEQRPREALRRVLFGAADGEASAWYSIGSSARSSIVGQRDAVFGQPERFKGREFQRYYKVTWDHEDEFKAASSGLPDDAIGKCRKAGANTDFYELYWAYRFRDTAWSQILSWASAIMTRKVNAIKSERIAGPNSALRVVSVIVPIVSILVLLGFLIGLYASQGQSAGQVGATPFFGINVNAQTVALVIASVGFIALIASNWLGPITFLRVLVLDVVLAVLAVEYVSPGQLASVRKSFLTGVLGAILTLVLSRVLLRGVGDAARYLTNSPDNIEEQNAIHSLATDLLRHLHSAWDPARKRYKYERIIIVGHSLGSVIAYDAICRYWAEVNRSLWISPDQPKPTSVASSQIESIEQMLRSRNGKPDLAKFRKLQWNLYEALSIPLPRRDVSTDDDTAIARWAISDLVTVGSPLAYADVLMAENRTDFDRRMKERELAMCPPVEQATGSPGSLTFKFARTRAINIANRRALHQAAAFACVRWTNIYHVDDLIGGPVADLFGWGVQDTAILRSGKRVESGAASPGQQLELRKSRSSIMRTLRTWPHSRYWDSQGSVGAQKDIIRRLPHLLIEVPNEASSQRLKTVLERSSSEGEPRFEVRAVYRHGENNSRYVYPAAGGKNIGLSQVLAVVNDDELLATLRFSGSPAPRN